jgi:ribonuclease G
MSKEIYISSTPHETRLAIVEDDQAAEVYYERENEYTLAGSIYKGRVTRVLPGMQSAFVDVGLERDAFLYVTDFLEEQEDSADFERIPAGGDRTAPAKENRDQRQLIVQLPEALADVENGASPASAGDTESAGNRRLRGRRGRRRGRSGERGSQSVVATPEPQGQQRREVEADYEPLSAREPQHQARFEPTVEHRSEVNRGSSNSAAPTPFVLPGESLSKYGSVPASSTSARQSAPSSPSSKPSTLTISRPSTLVDVPLTWDGGTTLPGESLSRHRGQPAQMPAHEASQAAESSIAADSAEAPAPSSPQEAAVEFGAEAAIASGADEARLFMPDTRAGSTYEPAHFEETASIHERQHEEELSASHRVNPAAPVEFRSKWVEDASVMEAPEPPASESAHASHTHDQQPEFPRQTSEWSPHPISESAGSAETTIIEPTGDMHSLALPPQEESAADQTAEFSATAETLHSGASGIFAPGEGLVEEEIIDEEESEYEPLAIHADESEFDELEEETRESLEGGDLGDMLRDAQIEQETRYLSDDPESEDTAQVDVFDEDIDAYEADPQGTDEIDDTPEAGVASTVVRTGQPSERRPRRGGHDRRFGRNQRGGPRGRKNTQSTSLPIISELLKQGQEILVQIAKEPIARKGARITSHIALPGRYLVFMPTVNHVGVSRKISSDEERRRLKHVLLSEKGDVPGGFIVRTAAGTASEEELRADIRFLINLWADVKQRADAGKAPALIYHDLSLVERVLRDQVTESFSTIWVDTEADYERVLRFLQRFQPAMVRRVKLYTKETPLFEQFGIQDEINKALKSKVWLKSGGSIVINQTEALVAIDINTGKYVGKTARLEDTIIKTNLDAIPEIVRQIRLRDLGGIIVIDFIDMDERKNRQKVMQALEEALKADRAPSKVLQFNDFGLVAITRKRVKQSLERTLSTQCIVCTGTGMVKSPVTVCNEIYVEMRKMRNHLEGKDVLLRVHPEVVKQLKSSSGKWLNELEEVAGRTIILKSDPTLQPEQFDIH